MGESIMAASNDEDKMGETAASNRALEVSVSFGRFENDLLSWEKWSSFSQNKYMEEVEKCATPGSVAEKKAYFEAHYKKIAARKAEQQGQEKQMEHDSVVLNDQNGGDPIGKACGADSEFHVSNGQIPAEGTGPETKLDCLLGSGYVGEVDEDPAINVEVQGSSIERVEEQLDIRLDSVLGSGHFGEVDEDAAINVEVHGSSIERVEEQLDVRLDDPSLNKPEEVTLVKEEETLYIEPQEIKDSSKKLAKETETVPVIKGEKVKLDHWKASQKTSPTSKIRDTTRIKKKPASPVAKSPQISTPKVPKTTTTSSTLLMSRPSTKKVTGSSLPKSITPSIEARKKVAPKSLHMSLSLDTPNSDPAAHASAPMTTTRKSFIMEKMKDKDIVKRAFKTFQKNFNQLKVSAEERSLEAKQVPTKGTEVKVSNSLTPRKENAGNFKAANMDKRTAKAAPSSFGLKSDERAEKRKEFSKKLEEKSKAKESESTRLQTKSKQEQEVGMRKLRQSLNFKATAMPVFIGDKKGQKGL